MGAKTKKPRGSVARLGNSPSRALWAQSLIRLLGSPVEFRPPKRQTTGRSKRISPPAARRRPTPLTEAASAQMSLIRICDDIWTASPRLRTPQNRQTLPYAPETKSTPPLFCPRRLVGPQTSLGTRPRNPPSTGAPVGSTSRSCAEVTSGGKSTRRARVPAARIAEG